MLHHRFIHKHINSSLYIWFSVLCTRCRLHMETQHPRESEQWTFNMEEDNFDVATSQTAKLEKDISSFFCFCLPLFSFAKLQIIWLLIFFYFFFLIHSFSPLAHFIARPSQPKVCSAVLQRNICWLSIIEKKLFDVNLLSDWWRGRCCFVCCELWTIFRFPFNILRLRDCVVTS